MGYESAKLDKRITFYSKERTVNSNGIDVVKPIEKFTCWARVRQQYLNEIYSSFGNEALEDVVTIIIRHQQIEEIKNNWLIEMNNKNYEIKKINPDVSEKKWTTILAKEVSV